jgi:alpha-amylase/alpha-mannosidase (GH57 family)
MADSLQHSALQAYPATQAPHDATSEGLIPAVSTGVFVCVHGHFYQPPRENPYLDAIEKQPSAAPYHNWNERIHYECYRPNAYARILNDRGEVVRIVNTFEYISFNIGPTLLSWMERYDLETYQRILDADRNSCARFNGHGNAIAQVYNHIILPLANPRDQVTQVRWGIADFRRRFGRDPEGIWLAETAIDYPTLDVLHAEGIKFTILAPSQVQRCRPLVSYNGERDSWQEVGGGQIDPSRPYRCFLKQADGSPDPSRYVDIFFYDGPISRDMGFNDVLSSSQHFAGRIGQAIHGDHRPFQLISVATDGETFGHHRSGAEKALAYALVEEFPRQGWRVTNYAHYLATHPPTWEAELKPVTAWSCSHGVDRWQDDCGCGGGGVWHQRWRRPLRDALDWLRDQLAEVFDRYGAPLLQDPWAARDAYVAVIGDRSPQSLNAFLATHQRRKLSAAERVTVLQLLEMQRHALFMYTSCGWFFEEISRPEGTQILRYAARAIELAGEVSGIALESDFIQHLAGAPSNVEGFKTGAGVYEALVKSSRISLEQVVAHYAMGSLFTDYHREQSVYCYSVEQQDYRRQRLGPISLAVGQVKITSTITRESLRLAFAVVHLGGWDFHCGITTVRSRLDYTRAKETVFDSLAMASAAQVILAINGTFGPQTYGLQDLFAEERHRMMGLLSQDTLLRLDQLYAQVYRDNYGVLRAFHRDGLPVPRELQVAADIALSHRAMEVLQSLERETSDPTANPLRQGEDYLNELEAIATEASTCNASLSLAAAQPMLERLIGRSVWQILNQAPTESLGADVDWLGRLVHLGQQLALDLSLERPQELYYQHLNRQVFALLKQAAVTRKPLGPDSRAQVSDILRLGEFLSMDVGAVLKALDYLDPGRPA